MTTSSYTKPFLSVDAQLDRLTERGLDIGDRESAYRQLQAIGYYRLSGYWYPFREHPANEGDPRPSSFQDGSTLDEVLEVYRFDELLRMEILHALSRIEVALRFRIGHLLGQKGPFAHHDTSFLDPDWIASQPQACNGPNCTSACSWEASDHDQWLRKQKRNESVSNEAFIAHFVSNYGMPLPVWTATEVMSFGDLNRLFAGMAQRDRQQIAVELDVVDSHGNGDARSFSNWLEHLRQTRNYCAHASRLWNRNHSAPLSAPATLTEFDHLRVADSDPHGARGIPRPARRVYGSLVLIAYLLARIDYTNTTRDSIRTSIEAFAASEPRRYYDMGFPKGWRTEIIWQSAYKRDADLAARAEMLREVILLYSADAAAQLTNKPTPKERSAHLRYYRRNGALLSVPGTEAHRYPSFQFDLATGDVVPVVVTANRRLLKGEHGSESERWAALQWWTSPNVGLPGSVSPLVALQSGKLSAVLIDALLDPRDEEERA